MTDVEYELVTSNLFSNCSNWINESKAYFSDVSFSNLVDVLDNLYIDRESKASVYYGPTIIDYLIFMEDRNNFTCHGYATLDDGEFNMYIEGLYSTSFDDDDIGAFETFSTTADVVRVNPTFLYCRWG